MIDLRDYGYDERLSGSAENGLLPARVIEVRRERYRVICEHGEAVAAVKGSLLYRAAGMNDLPAVGDFVLLSHDPGLCGVDRVLERRSKFSRTEPKTMREEVIAANFDTVCVCSSLNRDFNLNRIVRYVSAARVSGGEPVVLLTKADLCGDPESFIDAVRKAIPGMAVVALSSATGEGMDLLSPYLAPARTLVFLGMSGVGKSTLLNTLAGEALMDVREIRGEDARGRHTTTHRRMFRLPSGALVIDTPGMRELGLWNAVEGVSKTFAGVKALSATCKFGNCTHTSEPGCAVRKAIEEGALPPELLRNYQKQMREARYAERKSACIARRGTKNRRM
ncbi:MAG: ribosome small subunit-dependent GTPase A [Clostridia bacterium]|nr:ribosome small subunit-dependent GTPase A [Clostridia bacterium]